MKHNYFILIICFLLIGCPPLPEESDVIIKNANIIDMVTGEIKKRDVFIAKGRITQIVSEGAKDIYYGSKETINAKGKFLLPGFWDNHVHFRGGDSLINANKNFLKLFIANGITTVRDAGGDLTSSVMEWKKQIAGGDLVGPTIFTSGPKIDGPDATWAGSLEVENDGDIQRALDSLQSIPTDFVKLYESRLSGENYLATIKEAEKRGLITSGHMPFTVTLEETVAAGIDAIEHLYYIMKGCAANEAAVTEKMKSGEIGFWGAMPLLLKGYSENVAQKTFLNLKENDVYVVPTLHIGETLSYLDEHDHSDDSYLDYMGKGILKTYQGRIQRAMQSSEKQINDRKALQEFFGKLAKSLNDSGVGLLAGSDSGAFNSYTYPGISLHKELEQMVANGISPLEALRTSAYNGAKFLEKDSDYGTLSVGKIADLVLLEKNPLQDVKQTQNIHTVIKGTTVLNKKDLKELLASAVNNN
ncbi:amidohydrolase family protein [Maribacter sp. 2210JD10-5]|uniref:amidohydrolase family protein n=1 Tax=Maribacter sp. 2210JD10-5 TaxID=3386272 RepID=UPI0039BD1B57